MKIKDAIKIMEDWASPSLMDSWDNGGLLLGSDNNELKGILFTLDVTADVAEYCIRNKLNLIISHHPIIFDPIKDLYFGNAFGRLAELLIKNDISVYCAHTNLDLAPGGVNDVLAEALEIIDAKPLVSINIGSDSNLNIGYGRVGQILTTTVGELAELVKIKLSLDLVKVYGETLNTIQRVAICGGSGGEFIKTAADSGAQVYITGDIKYHDSQLASELGLIVIDATHYHTEKLILEEMMRRFSGLLEKGVKLDKYDGMPFAAKYY